MSDPRDECAIQNYTLWEDSSNELTQDNSDLWARLDAANYNFDGIVSVQSDTDPALPETTVVFYIAA